MRSQLALEFIYKPNEAPVSERNDNRHPGDQLQLRVKKSLGTTPTSRSLRPRVDIGESYWEDCTVPFELKRNEDDWEDASLFFREC